MSNLLSLINNLGQQSSSCSFIEQGQKLLTILTLLKLFIFLTLLIWKKQSGTRRGSNWSNLKNLNHNDCPWETEGVRQMCGVGRCHINWDQLNKYDGIQILLFLPVVSCRSNMGVSEGCLDGVSGCLAVSGWCLSVSGRCLGCVDVLEIETSWINIMIIRYYSFSQWPHAGQIWWCLKTRGNSTAEWKWHPKTPKKAKKHKKNYFSKRTR